MCSRHKSEMVGDVVKAQKEYDKVKRKLQDSEAELEVRPPPTDI